MPQVDFQEFEVLERAFLHSLEDSFDLGVTRFGKHLGKLDGLLDKKEGVGLVFVGLDGFGGDDVQFHALKDSNVLVC